jgi:hypothetical protein
LRYSASFAVNGFKIMLRIQKIYLLLLCLTSSGLLHAADEVSLDDVLGGFDEPSSEKGELEAVLDGFEEQDAATATLAEPVEAKNWNLTGDLTLSTSYNYAHEAPDPGQTDYRGLSRLRSTLGLELDGRISDSWRAHVDGYGFYDLAYAINGRDNYTDEVLDDYQSEIELGEAYLQGSLSQRVDLKLGRQIVVWGKSDNLRVTDVLNPLDLREPGMVDIEDLRLAVAMAKLDYYTSDWNLSTMIIPEVRFSKTPPFGSDFYPSPAPPPPEKIPAVALDSIQYAVSANGIFSGWDLSFYAADIYSDQPHLFMGSDGLRLKHARISMLGAATNVALGNWLLKAEAAGFSGLQYSNLPGVEKDRSDILLGMEYSGFDDTTLSLESVRRHVHGFSSAMEQAGYIEDEWQTALRYQGEFLHARLKLVAVATLYGPALDEGGFGRFSAAYDLKDALTVTGGLVLYEDGERPPFVGVGDNDRLFAEIKYSF